MKKLFALVLTLSLLCSAALAEICPIGTTGLTLDIGSLEVFDVSSDERANGTSLWFGDSKTLDCAVSIIDAEDVTLDELADFLLDDPDGEVISSDMVKLNGMDAFCMELFDGEDHYILYYVLVGDSFIQLACYYDGNAAARQFKAIAATLSPAQSGLSGLYASSGKASSIPGTGLTLNLTGLTLLELDADQLDDDMVLWFINDEESLICYTWVYAADDYTLADMADELADEEGCISSGYTTINGIDAYYWVGNDDGDTLVEYYVIDGENIVQISFVCENDAASQLSGQIMNTLTK